MASLLARKYLENMSNQTGNINFQLKAAMGPMMQMFFHFRQSEFLLFRGWMPQGLAAYLLSLLAVFALSALYEAIRVGRALLFRVEEASQQCCAQQQQEHQDADESSQSGDQQPCECLPPRLFYRAHLLSTLFSSTSLLSGWHLSQSLLHFLQFILGFALMLLAMTYNVPVFLAILMGHIFGYFLVGPLYRHGLAEESRVGGECCCS